jgi:SAM-dependent methyltransferase
VSKSIIGNSALRVVESAPFYREEVQLWSEDSEDEAHSLHPSIPYPDSFNPDLPAYFIRKYTKRGEVVLDPFCGSGTTALESVLQGRIAYASDISHLAYRLTTAKLQPADITEVTLRLQKANLRRPINLDVYRERFAAFYDVDTFREIANLRAFLHDQYDRVARFVEVMALSLLHGHSAGYFSVYSFPQISLTSQEQEVINLKRRQTPDYRAVVPRILRKTASSLRDGCPSIFRVLDKSNRVSVTDARDLSYIESGTVSLVVTAPPVPGAKDFTSELWLRYWFSQAPLPASPAVFGLQEIDAWTDYMNEVLLEAARVVRSGGRCVLDLKEVKTRDGSICLDEEIMSLVEDNLSRYWDVECILINTPRYAKLKNCMKERDPAKGENRLLVLRRR